MSFISVSKLSRLNASQLRALAEPAIVLSRDEPIRVLIPYEMYMRMQAVISETGAKP